MRVLRHLGLVERLRHLGVQPSAYQFKMFDSGEILQEIPLGDGYVERHGVPYLSVHRADLLDSLIGAVRALNADTVILNATATDFTEDADGVTLHFDDGSEARGDVLIGADGIKSMVRQKILGQTAVHYTGDQSWRILVPARRLAPDQRPDTVNICVGPGKHGVIYPIRADGLVNMVGCVEYESWDDESWTARRPWAEMKADFAGWHGNIQAIIDNADKEECYRWAMNNRPPVDNWRRGRATLLGDAAHPTLPYMAQGVAPWRSRMALLSPTPCNRSAMSAKRWNCTSATACSARHGSSMKVRPTATCSTCPPKLPCGKLSHNVT